MSLRGTLKNVVSKFLEACQQNDLDGALLLVLDEENNIPPQYLRHGLRSLAVTHQNYQGLGPLLLKSGAVAQDGTVDADFTRDVLSSSRDPMAAVLFLNGLSAKYNAESVGLAMSNGQDVAIQAIQSGNADVKQDNSRLLLHAAAKGQKDVFNELMLAGADPRAAIQNGSNDPRWDGTYTAVAALAKDFYKQHPGMEPKETVTLDSLTHMKEMRLSPTMDQPAASATLPQSRQPSRPGLGA